MKQHILTLFILLIARVGTMSAWDYDHVLIGELYYNLDSINQSAEVTCQSVQEEYLPTPVNYVGLTIATIPSTVEYLGKMYSVSQIGHCAFKNCASLTTVVIPNSVINIGDRAFKNCTSLSSINIPSSVTYISIEVFTNCPSLPVINNIRYADTYLVEAADKTLSSYTIRAGTKWIGSMAFESCTNLTAMTIPDGVFEIGYYAFWNSNHLVSLDIPSSVTSMDPRSFNGCSSLQTFNVDADNPVFCSINGIIFSKDQTQIIRYPGGKPGAYMVPDTVTTIQWTAFEECVGITGVTIPASVTFIGGSAFANCTNLTYIIDEAIIPQSIEDYVFHGTNCPIYVPCGTSNAYKTANGWVEYTTQIQSISPNMTVRSDTTIIMGDSVLMWATGVDFCIWSPENSLTKTSDNLIYAHPTQTTTYTVQGYSLSSIGNHNQVVNGDFEQGNVGFTTQLHYFTPYTSPGGMGDYTITDNVKGFWPLSHTPSVKAYNGTGNMMVVDGKTTPNSIVWSQQVTVEPNTYYAFSAQVMSCWESNLQGKYALLQFSINGTQLGPILHSPTQLYEWTQYYEIWYSGNNTTATLTILNQNSNGLGNDFAIDEIRLDALAYSCEAVDSVTIYVEGTNTDSIEIAAICKGETYTWHGHQYNTTITVTDTIPNAAGGDSICTLQLTVNQPSDSVEIASICAGESYAWHGQTFNTSTTKTETLTNSVGCDSICTLQLTVLPALSTDISAAIYIGESYSWNGETFTTQGDYTRVLSSKISGCDSIVTLHLIVKPRDTYEILVHPQCADDPYVEFEVIADTSMFHQLQFSFTPDALTQHFRDTIVDYTSSLIHIPNAARAGIYEVSISPLKDNNHVLDTRSCLFTLLYPSSVLDQHWDDFIGVLTHDYNGGYDFSGFQWYKNGNPIQGENHSYLYQPLEIGAAYSAMLEEPNGTKLMTCEIIASTQTDISLYPTLTQPRQIVRLHCSNEVVVQLYNNLGMQIESHSYSAGEHQFFAPSDRGIYIVKIIQTGEQGKSATKKLLVR